jgi:hypothetical protein
MISLKNIYFDEELLLYKVYDLEQLSGRRGRKFNKLQTIDKRIFQSRLSIT